MLFRFNGYHTNQSTMTSYEEARKQFMKKCEEYKAHFGKPPKQFYDLYNKVLFGKYPKRTHYIECRGCGMFADWHDIADDYNDDEFGICIDCETEAPHLAKTLGCKMFKHKKYKLKIVENYQTPSAKALRKYLQRHHYFEDESPTAAQRIRELYNGDEDMSPCSLTRFLCVSLDDTPYTRGEQMLAGWNSRDDSKHAGNPYFADYPYTWEK